MYNSYVLNNANMRPSRFPSTSTDDVTRRLSASSFTSSASVHQQQQFLQTLSSSLDGPLSPQHPTDVTSMSSRLYYDSVQLNHVTQQHADVLRCDVIAEPIKHFNAEYSANQDAERAEINDFLRVHYLRIAQGCGDVPVKELRHIIPILILSCFSVKGEQTQKKVKGLWERPPQGWPADVPYCDPNNAPIRSRTGQPAGTKPKKEILNLMFDFLIHEYTRQHGAYTANRVARNSSPSSIPIVQEVSHVTSSSSSSWPMASSATRATQQQQAGHWLRQTFPPMSTIQSRLATRSLPRSHVSQSQNGYNYHVTQAEMLQRHHHQNFTQTTLKRACPYSEDVDSEEMQLSASPSKNLRLASQNSSIASIFYPAATPTLTLKRSNSYDEASSTFSEDASRSRSSSSSSNSSKGFVADHLPSHIYCRSPAAVGAEATREVNIPVSTKQPTLPQLQLSQQQQHESSVNNLSQNISSHVPQSNISSCLSPVTHKQQQPASNYPMTKKARLLAAVAASSSPSPPSPSDVTNRLSPSVTSCSPSLPPAHLSTCPSPSRDQQAIDDVMARIVDKMRALEERQLTGERFGIVLTTKDLLWRMRPLVDSCRYTAYMDKLVEFDFTLDVIGVMGRLTESHYSKWQEFEDKWYIKVCGHTTYDVSDQEVATSYAHT